MNVAMSTLAAPRRRRPRWPWIVLASLLALLLIAVAATVSWVADAGTLPLHVVIDGDEVWSFDPALLGLEPWMAVVGVLAALLVVMVVVPIALVVAFAALAIGLVVGLGVPLLVAVLVLGLVLSPIWLLVALGVWLWRRSAAPRAA